MEIPIERFIPLRATQKASIRMHLEAFLSEWRILPLPSPLGSKKLVGKMGTYLKPLNFCASYIQWKNCQDLNATSF